MKIQSLTAILILTSLAFGCGLAGNFKAAPNANTNTNANASATTSPIPTESAAPTDSPSATPVNDNASLGRNLLSFGAGTIVVAATSESKMSAEQADKLIDESGMGEGWRTADGKIANESVTFELPARTTLATIVFDTATLSDNKIAPKDVRVEISDVSATDGFQTILETTLKEKPNRQPTEQGLDNQIFPVSKKITGRFLRYTAISNYGAPKSIFTKEIRGYGEQAPLPIQANISGTYLTGGGAIIHLKQDGLAVVGCNEQSDDLYEGTMNGRVLTFQAKSIAGKPTGFGFYSFAPDNQKFYGFRYPYGQKSFANTGVINRKSDKIGNCKFLPDLDGSGKDAVRDSLEKNIAATGRAVLNGINFDFNSDVLKPESKTTLDKIVAMMKEKADWKFSIEGHTDNVGGDTFNQTLSEKRAASVVKYLTAAGINASRLSSKGFGLSKPVAGNDSDAGRAQNRRVELVKN